MPRIIPARAGFTGLVHDQRVPLPDHPRSRGVYGHIGDPDEGVSGSSPLARGLLSTEPGEVLPRRIIPARAGFTECVVETHGAIPDHPRSRGVYSRDIGRIVVGDGSSPLARGLLLLWGADDGPTGIIPARAGFTRRRSTLPVGWKDHPRSRGVYAAVPSRGKRFGGSSPLARGLLVLEWCAIRHYGIIPARAGFTLADPWNPNDE